MADPLAYDTAAEWQEYLDSTFPDGMLATQILTTEASARADDSPQVLMSGIRVVEIEEDGDLLLSLLWAGLDKDTMLDVEAIEERDNGCFVVTSAPEEPDFLFSYNLTAQQREAVSAARKEALS